jgi:hypothetical protein
VSEESVEVVGRVLEHFVADREPLDELFAPTSVLDLSTWRDWIGQRQYEGVGGVRAFIQDWAEGLDDWRIETIAYRDAVIAWSRWGTSRAGRRAAASRSS